MIPPALLPPPATISIASWFARHSAAPLCVLYHSSPNWLPRTASTPLRISVIDSSFNPPTLAHLALASTGTAKFDAHILLLSVKNADKVAGPGETSPEMRLEMMRELALELEKRKGGNVAVMCCREPTFVGKSTLLRTELARITGSDTEDGSGPIKLSFALGWDTLIRLFNPKYYAPPAPPMSTALASFFDGSSVVCARRGDIDAAEEQDFLDRDGVKEWRSGIEMATLSKEMGEVSSSLVRATVKECMGDEALISTRLKGLVVDGVSRYIVREKLYR